jgi:three-Cys-motif partner protein
MGRRFRRSSVLAWLKSQETSAIAVLHRKLCTTLHRFFHSSTVYAQFPWQFAFSSRFVRDKTYKVKVSMNKLLETIWPLEPHTAKKHEILQRYFQAWLPILAQYNPRLLYIDAFAGPGEYSNGEDGSPVIILKAARDHVIPFKSELVCLFIESDEDRHLHLVQVLDHISPTLPANVQFRPLLGTFSDQLREIFTNMEEQRKRRAPTLAFVDPFGFSQTPFSAIARLMKYPKTEVLVNFMYEEINRFLSFPGFAALFDAQFGTPEWREAVKISDPLERLRAIHDLYLGQLKTVAKYVRAFLMVNKSNIPDYFLFFATNSMEGLEAMKRSMWKVDPSGEFQFSDFTDASKQIPLFNPEPDFQSLRESIAHQFRRTELRVEVLTDWVVTDTPYLRTHIKKQVLTPMEKEGAVRVVKPNPDRRPYTYPDGTILKFS